LYVPMSGGDHMDQMNTELGALKTKYIDRDSRMRNVLAVRQGRMRDVFPDMFPDGPFDRGIVANMIDVAARDLSEVLAPMPSFNCESARTASDAATKFAEKRTKIANGYLELSNAQTQMYTAADRYFTYGFVPCIIEMDFDKRMPRIAFMDSVGAYPVYNRWGEVKGAYFVFYKTKNELISEYPESARFLENMYDGGSLIEVVRHHNESMDCLFLPNVADGLMLEHVDNPTGECMVEFVRRPGVDQETHGQFDDVLAVQVAKARFALLSLEAAQKSVQAPLVLPNDVQELALGPDSVLRTSNGQQVRRVPIDIPPGAFATQAVLDEELKQGARYPDARGGNIDGSIVTGKGVQALLSGFDTQIRTGQAMFARAFTRIINKAFLADEKVFGQDEKTMRGNAQGVPYEIKYTPEKDIKGDYTVSVQYGLLAGLDPNRALVFGLQARGDKLISREFLMEQMPFALNPTEESQRLDIEEMRDALKQAVAGYAQAIPVLAQAGQDPGDVLARLSAIIVGRQQGQPIEKVIQEAFAPPEQPAVEEPGALPPEGAPAGADLEGISETGLMRGVAPGQAGLPPGGSADIQTLLAGLTADGGANLQAGVRRRIAV